MGFLLDLKLEGGRLVVLDELHIGRTYAGWGAGQPTDEDNAEQLLIVTKRARKLYDPSTQVHVIEPQYALDGGIKKLPTYYFAGDFLSFDPARDREQHASCLTIVWFQEARSPLLSDENAAKIRVVAWEQLAHDFMW
jgi:hypothetical protein